MFNLKQHNTTVRTELIAGITTFMAMAYILMVNAGMFSRTRATDIITPYILQRPYPPCSARF
ncbi:MAG: hypothetical protein V8Q85_05755 [Christensenellales bacterium]